MKYIIASLWGIFVLFIFTFLLSVIILLLNNNLFESKYTFIETFKYTIQVVFILFLIMGTIIASGVLAVFGVRRIFKSGGKNV